MPAACRFPVWFAALWLGAATAAAQPQIAPGGVVNAASALRSSLPGGAVAQGSLFSIFGSNLGPASGVAASEFPLAEELAGVSVEVLTSEGGALAALPIFAQENQINALMPSAAPAGIQFVRVHYNGMSSNAAMIKVVRRSFGAFTGFGPQPRQAIAQKSAPNGLRLVTFEAPAVAGDGLILWGTGLGPVEAPESQPAPVADLQGGVEVLAGGVPAVLDYAGRSPCCAGVDQINLRLAAETPSGCFVPVAVRTGGANFSNVATIAVVSPLEERGGEAPPCWQEDDAGLPPVPAEPSARILLRRASGGAAPEDSITGVFQRAADAGQRLHRGALFGGNDPAALPPAGSCIVYDPAFRPPPEGASAGAGASFTAQTPGGAVSIPRNEDGVYSAADSGLALGPGSYSVAGEGGPDFPAFSAALEVQEPLNWTNSETLPPFFRLRGLNINWQPGSSPPERVIVEGQVTDDGGSGDIEGLTHFLCSAGPGAGAFRIPPYALANIPGTRLRIRFVSAGGPAPLEFPNGGRASGLLDYRHEAAALARPGTPFLASTPVTLPDGSRVEAELAATFSEQRVGFMNRPEIPVGTGMLFLYTRMGFRPFWMFSTLVPLDIIWMDSERRVVFLSENTPPCAPEAGANCPFFGGGIQSQYVLELPAGEAARHGIEMGAQLAW